MTKGWLSTRFLYKGYTYNKNERNDKNITDISVHISTKLKEKY